MKRCKEKLKNGIIKKDFIGEVDKQLGTGNNEQGAVNWTRKQR